MNINPTQRSYEPFRFGFFRGQNNCTKEPPNNYYQLTTQGSPCRQQNDNCRTTFLMAENGRGNPKIMRIMHPLQNVR